MFASKFQGGEFLEIFSSQGSNPTENTKVVGRVKKEYEKQVGGYVFDIDGEGKSSSMRIPKEEGQTLGVVAQQRYLCLQGCIGKKFAMDLDFTDSQKGSRRIQLSSQIQKFAPTPFHARVPFSLIRKGVWLNLCLDIVDIFDHCFPGQSLLSLDCIIIQPSIKLRRVFTLKNCPIDTTDDFDKLGVEVVSEQRGEIPRTLEYAPRVGAFTQVITMAKIRADSDFGGPSEVKALMEPPRPIQSRRAHTAGTLAFGSRVKEPIPAAAVTNPAMRAMTTGKTGQRMPQYDKDAASKGVRRGTLSNNAANNNNNNNNSTNNNNSNNNVSNASNNSDDHLYPHHHAQPPPSSSSSSSAQQTPATMMRHSNNRRSPGPDKSSTLPPLERSTSPRLPQSFGDQGLTLYGNSPSSKGFTGFNQQQQQQQQQQQSPQSSPLDQHHYGSSSGRVQGLLQSNSSAASSLSSRKFQRKLDEDWMPTTASMAAYPPQPPNNNNHHNNNSSSTPQHNSPFDRPPRQRHSQQQMQKSQNKSLMRHSIIRKSSEVTEIPTPVLRNSCASDGTFAMAQPPPSTYQEDYVDDVAEEIDEEEFESELSECDAQLMSPSPNKFNGNNNVNNNYHHHSSSNSTTIRKSASMPMVPAPPASHHQQQQQQQQQQHFHHQSSNKQQYPSASGGVFSSNARSQLPSMNHDNDDAINQVDDDDDDNVLLGGRSHEDDFEDDDVGDDEDYHDNNNNNGNHYHHQRSSNSGLNVHDSSATKSHQRPMRLNTDAIGSSMDGGLKTFGSEMDSSPEQQPNSTQQKLQQDARSKLLGSSPSKTLFPHSLFSPSKGLSRLQTPPLMPAGRMRDLDFSPSHSTMSYSAHGNRKTPNRGGMAVTSESETPNADTSGGEEDDLELMYDPILNCYYDPRTNKYYELKN